VEIAQTVGRALVQHYGVRPEWGGMNYTVHEAIEKEESGETKRTILKHLRAPDDRRAAEAAMREMHRLLEAYAEGLARRHISRCPACSAAYRLQASIASCVGTRGAGCGVAAGWGLTAGCGLAVTCRGTVDARLWGAGAVGCRLGACGGAGGEDTAACLSPRSGAL